MQNFLSRFPMFADLDVETLSDLGETLTKVEIKAGECLFKQGEKSEGMYLIENGEICLEVRTPGDEVLQVATASAHGVVGEMALMDAGLRSASARAIEDTTAYRISRDRFELLKSNLHPAGKALSKSLLTGFCHHCQTQLNEFGSADQQATPASPFVAADFQTDERWPCGIEVMQQFGIFAHLSSDEITHLIERYQRLQVPANTSLYSRGDAVNGVFIVLRGALRSNTLTEDGELQLGIYGPGQINGYLEVFTESERIFNLATRENAELLFLTAEEFTSLINEQGQMAMKLLANVNKHAVTQLRKINNTASSIASFKQFTV